MKGQTEKVKTEIIAIYKSSSRKPLNVSKEHPKLYLKARRAFGSWKKALEACGIDYEETRNHKKWSREKVIREIRDLNRKCHSLRPKDLRENGSISLISAASYHFGSWRKAVEASGICYPCGRNRGNRKDCRNSYKTIKTKRS